MKTMLKVIVLLLIMPLSSWADGIVISKTLEIFDRRRNRIIPLVIYENETKGNLPIVLINHGYGAKNTEYSFFAQELAVHGYYVVSIQHDLESDVSLPRTGNLFERRKPLWERGVQNISFTISELKKTNPALNLEKIILIGHSNGGDISMMFTDKYPENVDRVISLDSLRYPFPHKKHIPMLSLRANDTKADRGVIPDSGVTIINMPYAKHIDLSDRGSQEVKEQVAKLIIQFLR